MSLKDKVVVITGGGSGIGADVAHAFYKAGAKVVLNGRREAQLAQTANTIDPTGERVVYMAGDIGTSKTSHNIVDLAVGQFGGVDVLLNNAGVFQPKPFLDHTEVDLDNYLNLLRGYFFISQAAIAQMQKIGSGAIINIGSMWAHHAIAATPCSGSSTAKGGVHALTRNLAIEFAPDRIRVNAIAPAVVETPLFDPLLTPEQLASFNAFHPLGRNGQVKDTTAAILFLADDAVSGWITGVVLPIDGGVTAGRNRVLIKVGAFVSTKTTILLTIQRHGQVSRLFMLNYRKARSKWETYWFKIFHRWRSGPLTCPIEKAHHRHVFWSWFGSFLAISICAYLTVKTNSPLLMAPFGATSVLIFGVPDSPLAQPRNVIGGNVLAALVGLIILHFLGASPIAMGMAVSITIGVMQLTGTVHPPSGAVALVVMMTKPSWQFLLTPAFEGSMILVLCAVIFNNLAEERTYPKHWL